MSSWLVERHYGFGAARIAIQPEPHRAAPIGFVEGVGTLVAGLTEGGLVATLGRARGEASAMLLGLLILAALVVTLTRDHRDLSPIEVVLLETVVDEPVSTPLPDPVEVMKPAPPPPPVLPQRIAEKLKPLPLPTLKPVVPKPRPRPAMPQIARLEAPKPPPLQKFDQPARERPQRPQSPAVRPRVVIEAARPAPSPNAPPPPTNPRLERIAANRVERANGARAVPRIDSPTTPTLDRPRPDAPERAFRVASARPTSKPRPRATTLSLASAAASIPAPAAVASPERAARLAPKNPAPRARRPTAKLASAARVFAVPPAEPSPLTTSRSSRAAPELSRGSDRNRIGLAGVPLAELASCLSDREEDRLKQTLVATVTTQKECVSSKGTYRFIETKNLNAFLMWIDRAPARPVSDRCVELGYALECLQSASRQAAR